MAAWGLGDLGVLQLHTAGTRKVVGPGSEKRPHVQGEGSPVGPLCGLRASPRQDQDANMGGTQDTRTDGVTHAHRHTCACAAV